MAAHPLLGEFVDVGAIDEAEGLLHDDVEVVQDLACFGESQYNSIQELGGC
jgi:hypothetical protein